MSGSFLCHLSNHHRYRFISQKYNWLSHYKEQTFLLPRLITCVILFFRLWHYFKHIAHQITGSFLISIHISLTCVTVAESLAGVWNGSPSTLRIVTRGRIADRQMEVWYSCPSYTQSLFFIFHQSELIQTGADNLLQILASGLLLLHQTCHFHNRQEGKRWQAW